MIGWNEVEPELPSDSYFIMIFTDKNNINFDDHTNTGDIESSNDISNSESSTSKNLSVINSSSHHKKLFYWKPESCKQKKNQMVDCSQEEEEEEGIRFPQIASNPKVTSPYNIIEYMKKSMPEIRGNNFRSSSNGWMTTSVAHVCIEEARSEEEDETEKVITDSELHNSIEYFRLNNKKYKIYLFLILMEINETNRIRNHQFISKNTLFYFIENNYSNHKRKVFKYAFENNILINFAN